MNDKDTFQQKLVVLNYLVLLSLRDILFEYSIPSVMSVLSVASVVSVVNDKATKSP